MSMEMQPIGRSPANSSGAFVDENGFLVQYTVKKYTAGGINRPLLLNPQAERLIKENIPQMLNVFESNTAINKDKPFNVEIQINPSRGRSVEATAEQGMEHLRASADPAISENLSQLAKQCAEASTGENELSQRVAILKSANPTLLEQSIPRKLLLFKEISSPNLYRLLNKVEQNQEITEEERSLINRTFENMKHISPTIDDFGSSDAPHVSFSIKERHIPTLSEWSAVEAYDELAEGPRDEFLRELEKLNPKAHAHVLKEIRNRR